MRERKYFSGDIAKAAGYLSYARKLFRLVTHDVIPVRKFLADGTRIVVRRVGKVNEIYIDTPSRANFVYGYSIFGDDGAGTDDDYSRVYRFTKGGVEKSVILLRPYLGSTVDLVKDIAVGKDQVIVTNAIDQSLITLTLTGKFRSSVTVSYQPQSIGIFGERIVVQRSRVDRGPPEVIYKGFTVYDAALTEILTIEWPLPTGLEESTPGEPDPLTYGIDCDETAVYLVGDDYVSDGGGGFDPVRKVNVYDISTGEFKFAANVQSGRMRIHEDKMYFASGGIFGDPPPTTDVVGVYTIAPSFGGIELDFSFGRVGPPGIDLVDSDGYIDFSDTAEDEFFNSIFVSIGRPGVSKYGVYIPEYTSSTAFNTPISRIKRFSLNGEFISNFDNFSRFAPAQIRSVAAA